VEADKIWKTHLRLGLLRHVLGEGLDVFLARVLVSGLDGCRGRAKECISAVSIAPADERRSGKKGRKTRTELERVDIGELRSETVSTSSQLLLVVVVV
jgi:hypothetical protein